MPRASDMQSLTIPGSTFQFSAVRPDELEASEFTLVTIAVDTSGSLYGFEQNLSDMVKTAVDACQKSPRAENLLVRVITFDTEVIEVHGFKTLSDIDCDNDYPPFDMGGGTALYDASYSAIGASIKYAEQLTDQDFDVNGVTFIITDGENNASTFGPNEIKEKIDEALHEEKIESLLTVLIGMVSSPASKKWLEKFKDEANLSEFIDAGDVTVKVLAKIAKFMSKSISSVSQKVGSGVSVSQDVTF